MPELAQSLAALSEAADALRRLEDEYEPRLEEARERFRDALQAAHEAWHSYGTLSRTVGLSRQRIAKLIAG